MADVFKFTTNRKSSGGGMQGGTRNCPGVHCKQKSVSPQLAAGCQPGEIQHRDVGRRNDEMHKAGQATGAFGFWLHLLQVLHGKTGHWQLTNHYLRLKGIYGG